MGTLAGRFRWFTCAHVALIGLTLFAERAHAEPEFPAALRDAAKLACVPACTVCHTDPQGGITTVHQPFGIAVYDPKKGFVAGDPGSLKAVVDKLDADKTDSNNDGVPDIEQMRQGYDPNLGNWASLCGPSYGCGARVASHRAPGFDAGLVFVAAVAVGGVFVRQRRRS